MAIVIECSCCRGRFGAPDEAAGKRVKCPKCSAVIVVGNAQQQQVPQVAIAQKKPSQIPVAVSAKAKPISDQAGESPRPLVLVWVSGGAITLLLVVTLLWFFIATKPPKEKLLTAGANGSMPSVSVVDRDPKRVSTAADRMSPPENNAQQMPQASPSESKEPPAPMYYTVEESNGQFTVVIHNSPLGRYEVPVPNLNGMYGRSSDDKKHYIFVSAWQGKVESVTWNKNNVPPNKDGAAKAGEKMKATHNSAQPAPGPISIACDNERPVFKYDVGELEGLRPGEWAGLCVFLARVSGPVLDERIVKAKDLRTGIAGQGVAFAYGSARGSVMFAHIAAQGSSDLAGYRLSIYDTDGKYIHRGAILAIPFSALDSLKAPNAFGGISATPSLDWEWLGPEVILSAGLVAFKTENGNFEFKRFLGPITTHRLKLAPQREQASELPSAQKRALANVKHWCSFKFDLAGGPLIPSMVEELVNKSPLGKTDYYIYVVIPGDKNDRIVPYRGGQLRSDEVRQLAPFLSRGCHESSIASTSANRIDGIYFFGDGKASDATAAPTLMRALKECTGVVPQGAIWLRFLNDTHQLVVSLNRNINVNAEGLTLHPDWKP